MKVRAELLLEIREYIRTKRPLPNIRCCFAGHQPSEVSALMHGHIFKFSIDALVKMLAMVGHKVKINTRLKLVA